jgi:tryptophan synthase alpha chain
MTPLETALRGEGPRVVAYLTGGFPDRHAWLASLAALESVAGAIEIGIPFGDPMADGATIQRSSAVALAAGTTLDGVLSALAERPARVPRVLMSYLNPLLAIPPDTLGPRLAEAHASAIVVPDLPHDEAGALRDALAACDVALAPMVTPLTTEERLGAITASARGFVYAVTSTGTTGQSVLATDAMRAYLRRVRAASRVPVLAGFGVRERAHVEALCPPADGVIVGSALVEAIERGEDPAERIRALR